MKQWLATYFETHCPRDYLEITDLPEEPIIEHGDYRINLPHFSRFVSSTYDVKLDGRELAQTAAGEGFKQKTVRIKLSESKATTRSMWKVPKEFIPEELREKV